MAANTPQSVQNQNNKKYHIIISWGRECLLITEDKIIIVLKWFKHCLNQDKLSLLGRKLYLEQTGS